MIEVSNLTKSFNQTIAVDDISFSVPRGQIVGLLGPNGAGKTTTMRMLTGFLSPDSGEARLAGHSVLEDEEEVKKKIGYLPENAPLYEDMVVEDYLRFMGLARGVAEEDITGAVEKMVAACSLETHFRKVISQLSKGYKQRVGLAATMIHNPDILILDEPTTGLDPNQIAEIRKLIIELGQEKTVILSTHIMQEVQETCGRVVIISQGRIVADDSVDAITAQNEGRVQTNLEIKADGDISGRLKDLDFIEQVEPISASQGGQAFKVVSNGAIGEKLFHACRDNNWVLVEMHTVKRNLETIFRQLTSGEVN